MQPRVDHVQLHSSRRLGRKGEQNCVSYDAGGSTVGGLEVPSQAHNAQHPGEDGRVARVEEADLHGAPQASVVVDAVRGWQQDDGLIAAARPSLVSR